MDSLFTPQKYLDAFIKTAQYLASLTSQQDLYSEIGKTVIHFFGADLAGFAERLADGGVEGHDWILPEEVSYESVFTEKIKDRINDVLESGFFSLHQVHTPDQYSVVILPIRRARTTVLMIGYRMSGPIPKELLNVYMAVAGLVGITTAELSSKDALRKARDELEEMVENRTEELRDAQEQLVRQERLAILGQLAGGMSHELRNPLAVIKNAAYFLNIALEDTDPEVKKTLGILEKEVETSERIINSLLNYALAKPPTKRKTDINQVVQESLSHVVPENVDVHSQLDEGLPEILADPDQLTMVFGNIVLNAVQAMPGGGRLTVKSEASSPDMVAISFSDTGVGISEENLGKIWEPLFSTKVTGIGLGLPITKIIVEAHGGTIEVESTVGEGATFTVKLPLGHMP